MSILIVLWILGEQVSVRGPLVSLDECTNLSVVILRQHVVGGTLYCVIM